VRAAGHRGTAWPGDASNLSTAPTAPPCGPMATPPWDLVTAEPPGPEPTPTPDLPATALPPGPNGGAALADVGVLLAARRGYVDAAHVLPPCTPPGVVAAEPRRLCSQWWLRLWSLCERRPQRRSRYRRAANDGSGWTRGWACRRGVRGRAAVGLYGPACGSATGGARSNCAASASAQRFGVVEEQATSEKRCENRQFFSCWHPWCL